MTSLSTGNGFPDVVVTGFALTTSLATDVEGTWQALLAGQSGIRTLDDPFVEEFDLPIRIGGHLLEDFEEEPDDSESRPLGYLQRMATVLGRRAWQDAGDPEVDANRLAVSIGTGSGGDGGDRDRLRRDTRGGRDCRLSIRRPDGTCPMARRPPSACDHGAKAGVMAPVSACASGSEGIAQAWRQIVLGEADIAICGGVETKIEATPIAAFSQMRIVMSKNNDDPAGACRPFDRDRDGFVFGEAGALLVIETEDHAKARGANIIARLMGASITSDGYHIVAPDPNGERAGHAMSRAIQLAGLTAGDIGHINAHATGTTVGDLAEAKAINNAVGNRAAVYAPKAALGHSVGASGASEAILTILALRDGLIPPTLNLKNLDPEIDLDVVAGSPRPGNYEYAVNNSFGFGGHNVALAFGRA